MADEAGRRSNLDPQITINDVVNNVKSEGIFDQFRKECIEEFENMESFNQLKQTVENHVASFLSKRRFSELLQKNLLRTELRNHLNKSEVLLNGIQRLVDEVLSLKGHGFCLKIDKQVDQFLNPQTTTQVEQNRHSVNLVQNLVNETPVSTEEISHHITPNKPSINNETSANIDIKEENISEPPKERSLLEEISPDINNQKNVEPNDVDLQEMEVEEVGIELGDTNNDMMVIEKHTEQSLVTENPSIKDNSPQLEQHEHIGPEQEEKIAETDESVEKRKNESESEKVKNNKNEIEDENKKEVLEEKKEINQSRNIERSSGDQEDVDSEQEGSQTPVQDEKTVIEDRVSGKNNRSSNSYYTSLVTEPISDDSSSNSTPDSFEPISEEDDDESQVSEPEEGADRRKSYRKRNIPLKYRDEEGEEDEKSAKGTDKKRPTLRKTRSKDTTEEIHRDKSNDRASSKKKERSHRKIEKSDSEKSRDRSRSRDKQNRKNEGGRSSGAVKRPSTPPEPEERFSKRPRRPTKQRERYSPS
ncbi:biorientation of chromosomes in cell division protein 1-like 1 [Clytia hemisphaerica]|uniref:BOD1/SHG1 domain-containing protein n=1 Tax=Clytia hemisphaerica TaxID=252671 RepID=A0A7M5V8D3_9CNID|eukprot:TCONS_00013465-protein